MLLQSGTCDAWRLQTEVSMGVPLKDFMGNVWAAVHLWVPAILNMTTKSTTQTS